MRIIFPIYRNNKLSSAFAARRVKRLLRTSDQFKFSNPAEFKFEYIKLKTAEKLYNTEFTPSDKNYGDYTYKTFVLDNKTGETVEMVVKPMLFDEFDEEFIILDPNRIDKKGEMEVAGKRYFALDSKYNYIQSGSMDSYLNEIFEGLGCRAHQIAI